MASNDRERIQHFFGVFRHRIDAIAEINNAFGRRMLPERFILVSAGLDALAKYWKELYRTNLNSAGERMGEFLVEHGNRDVFERVSAPLLIQRARSEGAAWLPVLETAFRVNYDDGTVREWKDDPTFARVVADPAVAGAGIDVNWIRWGRYGEILYREIRNSWIHESGEPRDLPPADYKVFD